MLSEAKHLVQPLQMPCFRCCISWSTLRKKTVGCSKKGFFEYGVFSIFEWANTLFKK